MNKKKIPLVLLLAAFLVGLFFLAPMGQAQAQTAGEETVQTGTISGVEHSVTVRAGANSASDVKGWLPNGAAVEIDEIIGEWALIFFNDTYGYVSLEYVNVDESAGTDERVGDYQGTVTGVTDRLNVRSGADASSSIRGSLPNGTTVEVEDTVGNWALIYFDGTYGYVSLNYLSLGDGTPPAPSPPESSRPLADQTIAIDPGHGGEDQGGSGSGILEKDVTLDIGQRVQQKLDAAGADVVMTRETDVFIPLEERASLANAADASSFVSIHTNAFNGSASGTEHFYYAGSQEGAALASMIQEEMVKALGTTDRGMDEADFSVLRNTDMPAVLAEVAFIDESSDAEKLRSSAFKEAAADAVVRGLERYYNE